MDDRSTLAVVSLKLDTINTTLKSIDSNFKNGFRAEIKEHLENGMEDLLLQAKEDRQLMRKILHETSRIAGFGFWAKMCGSFTIAIGSLALLIIALF